MKKATLLLFQLILLTAFFLLLFSIIDLVNIKSMKLDKTPFLNLPSTSSIMVLVVIFMILILLGFFIISKDKPVLDELPEDYDRLTQ